MSPYCILDHNNVLHYDVMLFQVSLWGGDAVFNNLDLRLDVLEEELRLPFSLVSGHIHELQIHVPWTRSDNAVGICTKLIWYFCLYQSFLTECLWYRHSCDPLFFMN